MAEIAEDKVKTVGRKRGRPRTVTDDHEVPEVGLVAIRLPVPMLTLIYRDAANNFALRNRPIANEKRPRSVICRIAFKNWKLESRISATLSSPSVIFL
jgi:hypothetical protein